MLTAREKCDYKRKCLEKYSNLFLKQFSQMLYFVNPRTEDLNIFDSLSKGLSI